MKPSSVIDELSHRNPLPIEGGVAASLSTDARDLLRTIVSTPRDQTAASAAGPRRHGAPARRILIATAVAGIAASSLALAGVFSTSTIVRHSTSSHPHVAAVAFLTDAAVAASSQPSVPSLAAGQYYYEKDTDSNLDLCQLRRRLRR